MTASVYDTVTAMIAPALFLTATGSLIISTASRTGRIVDRIRVLVDSHDQMTRADEALDFLEKRREHIFDELRSLQVRSHRALIAVTMLYLACGSFAATSLMIAIDSLLSHRLAAAPTAFAVTGVGLLLIACTNLVREARTALLTNDLELRFLSELERLRTTSESRRRLG